MGYTGNAGSCSACPGGTYKNTQGNAVCSQCNADFISPLASTAALACTQCAVNSAPDTTKTACLCNMGYTLEFATCSQCAPGKYKHVPGNAACTGCNADSISPVGSTAAAACTRCPVNSTPDTAKTACLCNVGYTGNAASCSACPGGTYKNAPGSAICIDCNANLISFVGSTVVSACTQCVVNSAPNTLKTVCLCNMGHTLVSGSCSQCAAGTYKPAAGNAVCTSCDANSISPVESTVLAACTQCLVNSAPDTTKTACVCNMGHTLESGSCLQCAAGTYKTAPGNAVCTSCNTDSISFIGSFNAGACTPCATGSTPNNEKNACLCNMGFSGAAGNCLKCPEGKYKNTLGSTPCTDCDTNTPTSPAGSTSESACTLCGDNREMDFEKQVCVCKVDFTEITGICQADCAKGFTGTAGSCSVCPGGTYKNTLGSTVCIDCPANTPISPVQSTGVSSCTSCGLNRAPNSEETRCDCRLDFTEVTGTCQPDCAKGFTGTAGSCSACPGGTYKDATGSASCVVCNINTPNSSTASIRADDCMLLEANPGAPSTTPIPTGTGNIQQTTVLVQVEIPMSMDEFFAKQEVFLRGLSNITAVAVQKIRTVGMRQVSTTRRRLLLSRMSVDVEIVVESRAMAEEVVRKLTQERLNLKNTENGLPALKLVSVVILPVPTTPMSTPAPYSVVRVFVYRLLMTMEEFDAKRDAFRRALALAYAVPLDRVVVKSLAKFTQASEDTRQSLLVGIEVGVSIAFSNIAHSEAVVAVSAINDALQEQGLPVVIELVVTNGNTQPATDQSSGIPTVYVWVFYGVGAATFVMVLCVCIRLGFGSFCHCCGINGMQCNNRTSITGADTYFAMPARTPIGYV